MANQTGSSLLTRTQTAYFCILARFNHEVTIFWLFDKKKDKCLLMRNKMDIVH